MSLTHSKLYPLVHSTPDRNWYGLGDMIKRTMCSVNLYYYLLLTNPISMTSFTWKYNNLWYGSVIGPFMTLGLPIEPAVVATVETAKAVYNKLTASADFDSNSVFFVAPKGWLSSWLWDFNKNFSVYVTAFMICRDSKGAVSPDAIGHTWYDSLMDKWFWRGLLEKAGARVPRELGRWSEGKFNKFIKGDIDCDVVFKLPDSYLGIGDLFWDIGKDFQAEADLITKLKTPDYADKEVLVLEMIRPSTAPDLPAVNVVHQLDMLTINSEDEGVKCFNVIYWGGCTDGKSSHSTTEGYLVDVETETITGPTVWYSAYFANMKPSLIGAKVPGVKKAVESAIKAHKAHPYDWCRVIGWDCIITNNGPVFFEGNIAAHRTPRRVTLDWPNPWAFAKAFGL